MATNSQQEQFACGSRVTVRERVNSRVKNVLRTKPCVFSGNVASFIAEVGCLFLRVRPAIWESCRQKVHRTVARARFDSICISNFKKMACSEHFWKMRPANVHQTSPDCNKLDLHLKTLKNCMLWASWQNVQETVARAGFYIKFLKKNWHVRSANVGRFGATLRVCNRLWQNALAQARAGKHSVMLRRSWQAGLQLEVVEHIVTASRKVGFNHSATLVLCGIAAGGCKTHCAGCAKRRIGLQKLQKR